MNKVIMIGNLTRDPETKVLDSGKMVTNFSIAVNERKDVVDYFNCEAWEKTADLIQNYCKKGHKIAIEGRIKTKQYEKDGEKRYTTYIICSNVEFLTQKTQQSDQVNNGGLTEFNAPF